MSAPTTIFLSLAPVRDEIEDLERRLAKLRQVEAILLDPEGEELAPSRASATSPRAPVQERPEQQQPAASPRPRSIPLAELDSPTSQRQPIAPGRQPATSDDDAKTKLREALVERERTTVELLGVIGLSANGTTRARVKRLLEEIGAHRDGAIYTITGISSNGHSPEAPPSGDLDGAYLERRILGELDRGMFTTAQLAERLDIGTDDVIDALRRLERAKAAETTPDGMWTTA